MHCLSVYNLITSEEYLHYLHHLHQIRNRTQNQGKNGGDIISTRMRISPLQHLQIHAQTGNGRDNGDIGDIF